MTKLARGGVELPVSTLIAGGAAGARAFTAYDRALSATFSSKHMKSLRMLSGSPAATMLAMAIVLTWCVSALALNQPLLAVQRSSALMAWGAANGELLHTGEWWRILSSQFLHVHFLHMLFNAACIAIIGAAVERRYGWWALALVYVAGGSAGQVASVVAYPQLVSSGASQALMALSAAALVARPEYRLRLFVVSVVAIQVALDLYVAHAIKAGHGFGFLGGLLVAVALPFLGPARSAGEAARGRQGAASTK